jgi:hypothetical protein
MDSTYFYLCNFYSPSFGQIKKKEIEFGTQKDKKQKTSKNKRSRRY